MEADYRGTTYFLSNFDSAKFDKTRPLLVCFHGNSSCAETFKLFYKCPVQTIAPDLPGCGNSARWDSYSMESVGKEMSHFIMSFEPTEVWLLGHSLGGHLTGFISSDVPVTRVFLAGTPPLSSADDFPLAFTPEIGARELIPLLSQEEPFDLESAIKFTEHTGYTNQNFIAKALLTDGKFRKGCLSSITNVDQVAWLRGHIERGHKVVFLHAVFDGVINRDYLAKLCRKHGFKIVDFPCKHMSPILAHEQMIAEIVAA